jgi:hypothetical protein
LSEKIENNDNLGINKKFIKILSKFEKNDIKNLGISKDLKITEWVKNNPLENYSIKSISNDEDIYNQSTLAENTVNLLMDLKNISNFKQTEQFIFENIQQIYNNIPQAINTLITNVYFTIKNNMKMKSKINSNV